MRWLTLVIILIGFSCNKKTGKIALGPDGVKYLKSQEVKLNHPIVISDSTFFFADANVKMEFELKDAEILYSFNDDNYKSYSGKFSITESGTLHAKVTSKGFNDSDKVSIPFIKVNNLSVNAEKRIYPEPDSKYYGDGVRTLFDHQKGSKNFKDGNYWCGFQDRVISIDINFEKPTELKTVHISTLSDPGSWIFTPEKISVLLDDQLIAAESCKLTEEGESSQFKILPISFQPTKGSSLQVIIENMAEIPDWHPGTGTPPWLFIDEIIIE
ncbi:MAG: hypothetical protein HKN68_07405 [Saprospiraceae bacterium]|nr:hypothetical protein [Saprospiraceae bacterium]